MRARDQLHEKRVGEKFEQHRKRLEAEVQLSSLMPYLQKQQVLSVQENATLMEIVPERRNRQLLEILVKKGPQFLVRFVECLEASPENKTLTALFAPPSGSLYHQNTCRFTAGQCSIFYLYYILLIESEWLSQPGTTRKLPEGLEKHGETTT